MQKSIGYYTGLTVSQMIEDFEREVGIENLGRFYNWADQSRDHAFSKAASKLNIACERFAQKEMNWIEYVTENAKYYETMSSLASEFRKEKGLDETRIFLDSLVS